MMETDAEQWQPIETVPLPRFRKRDFWDQRLVCLVYSAKGVELGVYSFTSQGDGVWSGYGTGPSHRIYPTHWMPLPKPPTPTKDTPQ
jgi:hypothetical protein